MRFLLNLQNGEEDISLQNLSGLSPQLDGKGIKN
jgi:hypothetical protein